MKKAKIAALAAGILILSGCGNQPVNNSAPENAHPSGSQSAAGGIITSIKDAMGLGTTMECTYKEKDENGKEFVSKAYIKGEKYKAFNEYNGKKYIYLSDGDIFYSWVDGEKAGEKMRINCFDDLNKDNPQNSEYKAPEENISEEKNFDNAQDVKCTETSGIDFSAPSDIVFADQCEAMRKAFENPAYNINPILPDNMPANLPK